MKETIKNLIKLSEEEIENVAKLTNSDNLVMFWSGRLQAFKEIIILIEEEENKLCITEVIQ